MPSRFTSIAFALLLAAAMPQAAQAATHSRQSETVTIGGLLKEMADRDAVARYPDPAYTSASFSSYDRASLSKEQDWFANNDNNWFLRRENTDGRDEYVLFDAEGPGAVTRWWMTFAGDFGGSGCIRIYIDGDSEPAVTGNPLDILSGDKIAIEPLASSISKLTLMQSHRGLNLFYPIPYAKHCKITYSSDHIRPDSDQRHITGEECIYYNIEYRSYAPGTAVESYSAENAARYSEIEKEVASQLANPCQSAADAEAAIDCTIAPGGSAEFSFKGPAAIREITMQIDAPDIFQALRSTVVEIVFDGQSTVFIPAGEFFGVGYVPLYTRMWYVDAQPSGPMSARWTMPFKKKATVRLVNYGSQTVCIHDAKVATSGWKFDRSSMYFHAIWRLYPRLDTRTNLYTGEPQEHYDINFVNLRGKGVYMGDSMSIFDMSTGWWGEGDEKIYIDGSTFPDYFGTGSEDYYGYAWCHPNTIVDHPFSSQPSGAGNMAPGFTFNSRHRCLDRIAFGSSLVFDMEMWHWEKSTLDLGVSNYFYMLPGGKVLNERDSSGVASRTTLSAIDFVDLSPELLDIEAEYLKFEGKTGGTYEIFSAWGDYWSRGQQILWGNAPAGTEILLSFESPYEGSYKLKILNAFTPIYGSVDVWFNGNQIESCRSFRADDTHTEWTDYGAMQLLKGKNTIRVKAVEVNPLASTCFYGIDRLVLEKL